MNHGFITRTIQLRRHAGKEQHERLLISELTPNSRLSSEPEALPETPGAQPWTAMARSLSPALLASALGSSSRPGPALARPPAPSVFPQA